ncbi:hypothetical protein J6590_019969 [Homalodisca vitripennis]|nr:hypothetical protein J6590_019969 [Homalodisca vitripennis]
MKGVVRRSVRRGQEHWPRLNVIKLPFQIPPVHELINVDMSILFIKSAYYELPRVRTLYGPN